MTNAGPIVDSPFEAARWLRGPHAQTLWGALAPRGRPAPHRLERWEQPDGDFVDLLWSADGDGPLVVILHGLEGGIESRHIVGLRRALALRGWSSCVLLFRNCGDRPNRLARSYHSGETGDLDRLIARLRRSAPDRPLAAVGFSLGGNVLLKWLGENGARAALDAAVAVSVPMRLDRCADRLQRGLSRLYQWHLLRHLRGSYRRKFRHRDDPPFPLARLAELRSFRRFDDRVTAPLHGFAGVDDYYRRCSSRGFLAGIRVPTLVIQARDDPFMTPDMLPSAAELSATTTLELSPRGGHVGFVGGPHPCRPRYWLDRRIPAFLAAYLDQP